MALNVLSGIVRIVSGRHIGTGFVVTSDGLILTCAHVLGPSMPEKARVVFLGAGEECEATVLAEGWHPVDAEDVAVLRVSGELPEGVHPLPFGSSEGIEGHAMVTFGYPETGEVEGIRGTGTILGHGTRTKAGQALLQLRSSEITKGFIRTLKEETPRMFVEEAYVSPKILLFCRLYIGVLLCTLLKEKQRTVV